VRESLTRYGVIVEGHPIEAWVVATVFVPPRQKGVV
jgi:hypothetical protein